MTQGRPISCFPALLLLILMLTGCGFRGERIGLDSLTLDVAERANDDTPIAVDFVAVHDPDLLKLLSEIPSRQWFT